MADDTQDRRTGTKTSSPADNNVGTDPATTNGPPTLSLPKGGGAIRGIGEKFSANPVTGTGSLTVPIATSPGRAGFGPTLALSYDSGAGNGAFGLGWSLSLPSISRRTDKGLPQYQDASESDIFILSGAEDLVRTLAQDAQGDWGPQTTARDGYVVTQYRPRIEGLFSRIERWTRQTDGDTYWRSISKENVTTVYGQTPESRVADPSDPRRIFTWLVSESFDDKGNAITYAYVSEDSTNVDASRPQEGQRTDAGRSAARYLKRILYGNTVSRLAPSADFANTKWLFEVVFDYGEGHLSVAAPDADGREYATATTTASQPWPARQDPFSRYRATFEVRTYRLCRRVLMFHHFPELGVADYLVRATEFGYREGPIASFITSVTQSGFTWQPSSSRYLRRSLPPLELEYTEALVQQTVHEVDPGSLENLPGAVDGLRSQWLDLDGEGLQGILSESGGGWYYKRNLSPLTFHVDAQERATSSARFEALSEVSRLPAFAKTSVNARSPRHQFLDLSGDGQVDCVVLERPATGFYERTEDEDWEDFTPLRSTPNVDWNDPNLRFIDVDGDGHADVLVTENDAFVWYPSLAEAGFGGGIRVPKARTEDDGPAVIFADAQQSIFLADMSGDGLTDIVRIRNGEICYWPNLGYGRFGRKVVMDQAPLFEAVDLFDPRRVRLADIDGSGTVDIVYLASDGICLYFNQAGNAWSPGQPVTPFPAVDRLASVQVVDLLGNGTACLVWSSSLPADGRRTMRYVDLMGGQKPHLLVTSRNNLGAETHVRYAPSTKFYLEDRRAGTPWATRLPFPVHVVERVATLDLVSRNRFVSRYSYHHGFYDGIEREFRGFGRVDQTDTEELGALTATGILPTSENVDAASYVPPVLTKTWFHTGALVHGRRISRFFEREYYRESGALDGVAGLTDAQLRAMELPDSVLPIDTATNEVREAVRSLKGSMLRQEVYALDGTHAADRPYSVSEHNYTIRREQPFGGNRHAVFFTHARESIDFHYERKLYAVGGSQVADPRVTHAFVLAVDLYGNALQSAAVGYGRRHNDPDPVLTDADHAAQQTLQITYTENTFTTTVLEPDAYRPPLPAESRTYELVNVSVTASVLGVTNLLRFEDVTKDVGLAGDGQHDLLYVDIDATGATQGQPYRRLIEQVRTLYRNDLLTAVLPLGICESRAIPSQTYKLALTQDVLALYARGGQSLLPATPKTVLGDDGGYVLGSDVTGFLASDPPGTWWIPSGQVFFSADTTAELATALAHFFVPQSFRDPFGHDGTVRLDAYDLLPLETQDALGNRITVGERASDGTASNGNDYRVLQPKIVTDPNGNRSAVAFDTLGLVIATAVMGKPGETLGDVLPDPLPDPTQADIDQFFQAPTAGTNAASLLSTATSRVVYDVDRFRRLPNTPSPSFAATIVRETHASDPGGATSKLQVTFSYGDGFGREIQRKIRAEDGPVPPGTATVSPRWVGSGWTVFNNKGKPVRKYEPYFSATQDFEFGVTVGVSSILIYDPVGRVVATVHPNKTWEKVVFDPWRQDAWDANDTVAVPDPAADADVGAYIARLPTTDYASTWYAQRTGPHPVVTDPAEQAAAQKAFAHKETPATTFADALGRAFLTVAFNRSPGSNGPVEAHDATRVTFDIEGNQRAVTDALGRVVMRYDYDLLGTRIHQASMEAGERWMLGDVAGKPIRGWNSRTYDVRTEYDPLRRAVRAWVQGSDGGKYSETFAQPVLFQRTVYGEQYPSPETLNLRGRAYMHFDPAGVVTSGGTNPVTGQMEAYDFKGNPLRGSRRLAQQDPVSGVLAYKGTVNWAGIEAALPTDFTTAFEPAGLEKAIAPFLETVGTETFATSSTFDALNRIVTATAPDGSVSRPTYNEANLLESLAVNLRGAAAATAFVQNIVYNARGQRIRVDCGQKSDGTAVATTEYDYDPATFRLTNLTTTRLSPSNGFATQIFKNGTVLQSLAYTYDPVGNITRITDGALLNAGQVDPTGDYTYDAIYRLIVATGREHVAQTAFDFAPSSGNYRDYPFVGAAHPNDLQAVESYTESYTYDAVGNFKELTHRAASGDWIRDYTYAEASFLEAALVSNQLTSTTLHPGANQPIVQAHAYDAHGNMTKMVHLPVMGWDFRDELRMSSQQVVSASSTVGPELTYYVYDGAGQRVRKVTELGSGTKKNERFYLGGWEVYREYDAATAAVTLERQTLHVMDDKQRVAMVDTKTVGAPGSVPEVLARYQFANHLGSATLELDDAANVISYEEYSPYGSTTYQAMGTSSVEVSAKRYRYTGMERDEETGLAYHSARYYAPWLGSWTGPDPASTIDGPGLYTYGRDNPFRYHDITGMQSESTAAGSNSQPFTRAQPRLLKPFDDSQLTALSVQIAKQDLGLASPPSLDSLRLDDSQMTALSVQIAKQDLGLASPPSPSLGTVTQEAARGSTDLRPLLDKTGLVATTSLVSDKDLYHALKYDSTNDMCGRSSAFGIDLPPAKVMSIKLPALSEPKANAPDRTVQDQAGDEQRAAQYDGSAVPLLHAKDVVKADLGSQPVIQATTSPSYSTPAGSVARVAEERSATSRSGALRLDDGRFVSDSSTGAVRSATFAAGFTVFSLQLGPDSKPWFALSIAQITLDHTGKFGLAGSAETTLFALGTNSRLGAIGYAGGQSDGKWNVGASLVIHF